MLANASCNKSFKTDQVGLPKKVKPTINILRSSVHVYLSFLYANKVMQHISIIE